MNEKSELAVFDGYNKQKIEVMFQEEANLEVKMPLFYVNSGKKELESYVEDNCKPELAEYTVSKQGELSAAVEEVYKPELKTYTETRKEDILYYVESTSKPKIDDYVDAEIVPHSTSAQNAAAAALASEQAAKISEDNAKASELAAAESAAEAKQYRDEAEEIVRPSQATEDKIGLAAIATTEEIEAGVDDTKFITPKKASNYFQSQISAMSEKTNCITKIPQDIKLELNNGTLTLKAGSRVYRGDSSIVNISSDVVRGGTTGANLDIMLFYNVTTKGIQQTSVDTTRSFTGSSIPQSGIAYASDTKKFYVNGVETDLSLPIAIVSTDSNGKYISVNQVFNGFGYIGNVIFALPGVEGLIPNGRNSDGGLNNSKNLTTEVCFLYSTDLRTKLDIRFMNNEITRGELIYNPKDNLNYNGSFISSNVRYRAIIGDYTSDSTGRVLDLNVKPVFQAQDYHTAARVGDDNVFTGNNTFSGTVNFEAQRVIFKEHAGEGGEFYVEIPKSKVDELGNYWNVDVNSNGNIRFFRTNGTAPKVVTSINAKTGVINYEVGTALSASDNSTQVPTTSWIRSLFTGRLASNGYVKIPVSGSNSPLIIQWGFQSSAKSGTISFPTPFSSLSYGMGTMCGTLGTGAGAVSATYSNRTTTSFDWASRCGSGGTNAIEFLWLAIGY